MTSRPRKRPNRTEYFRAWRAANRERWNAYKRDWARVKRARLASCNERAPVYSAGSAELDRALAARRRIHEAWGIRERGRLPHERSDHFVGVTEKVLAEANPILVNFRTRTITRGGEKVKFGRRAFRLMTALLASKWPLMKDDLILHLYGDGICGRSCYARGFLRCIIYHCRHGYWLDGHSLRPKLVPLRLRIVTDRNRGYTIVRD